MSTSEMFTTHVHQGVVTFMSRVEVFATGFKIESGNQSPFGGPSSLYCHKLRAVQSTTNVQRPRTRLGGAGLVKTIDSIHLWNGIGNIEIVMQTLRL